MIPTEYHFNTTKGLNCPKKIFHTALSYQCSHPNVAAETRTHQARQHFLNLPLFCFGEPQFPVLKWQEQHPSLTTTTVVFWPLALSKHFHSEHCCSLEIFSFSDHPLWTRDMVEHENTNRSVVSEILPICAANNQDAKILNDLFNLKNPD